MNHKVLPLLLLISLIFSGCKTDDEGPVYEGDLVISTLEAYNNFNYEYVFGTLTIENLNSPDLSKMQSLTDVGGLIIRNSSMTSLNGLDNLKFINNDLIIENNENLTSICCLNKVERVESLQIINHPNLTSISGLSGIQTVNDTLRIRFAPLLSSLHGLQNLRRVNAPFNLNEVGITSLDGLPSLNEVQSLLLYRLDNLITAEEWSLFTKIESDLRIEDCAQLTTLKMPSLSTVQTIFIGNNPSLVEVDLGQVENDLEFVTISGSGELETLRGLENVERIRLLSLAELFLLEDLLGFSGLIEVSGDLRLTNLHTLTSFDGFHNLISAATEFNGIPVIGSEFLISNLAGIESLTGLENLQTVGQIRIQNNASLTNLNGTNLQSSFPFGCRMFIENNVSLTNYCGFTHFLNNVNVDSAFIADNAYNPNVPQIRSETECSL